mgnify:CR=1 FL=1
MRADGAQIGVGCDNRLGCDTAHQLFHALIIEVGNIRHDAPPRQLTFETERSLGGYMWADNQRLLYMKDHAGDENYQLYGILADGTDARAYTDFPGVRVGLIDDLEDVPDEVIISMNRRNPEAFDPYRLNLSTGQLTLLAENPGNYQAG